MLKMYYVLFQFLYVWRKSLSQWQHDELLLCHYIFYYCYCSKGRKRWCDSDVMTNGDDGVPERKKNKREVDDNAVKEENGKK